jgi:hypothetical protein
MAAKAWQLLVRHGGPLLQLILPRSLRLPLLLPLLLSLLLWSSLALT